MFPVKDDPDLMWVKMITFNLGLLLVGFIFIPFHGLVTRRSCRVTISKAENMCLHLRLRIVSVNIQMTNIANYKGTTEMKERMTENIENSGTKLKFHHILSGKTPY